MVTFTRGVGGVRFTFYKGWKVVHLPAAELYIAEQLGPDDLPTGFCRVFETAVDAFTYVVEQT